jgi:hypothetical protein
VDFVVVRFQFGGPLEESKGLSQPALRVIRQAEVTDGEAICALNTEGIEEFDLGFIVLFTFEELLAAGEVAFEFCGTGKRIKQRASNVQRAE